MAGLWSTEHTTPCMLANQPAFHTLSLPRAVLRCAALRADDEEGEAEEQRAPVATGRGGYGGRGFGGRGRGRGRGAKAARLDANHELAAGNYAGWPPAAAAAAAGGGGVREASTADSREIAHPAGPGAARPGPPHPAAMQPPLKRASHTYIAHFIDWHKAQAARGGHGADAAAQHGGAQQAGQPGAGGYPALRQQAQQPHGQAQQLPPSPTSRLQQLLAARGLPGAAGLFAGAGAQAGHAPLPAPTLLERHGPPGVQPSVTAALMQGGFSLAGARLVRWLLHAVCNTTCGCCDRVTVDSWPIWHGERDSQVSFAPDLCCLHATNAHLAGFC